MKINIIDYAINHSRVIMGILFFILVAGTTSYINIPKEATPDVNIPFIYISLSQKGISPDDSERLLIKPVEDEVKTVEGVKEVRSTAYNGGGNVLLEFNPGFDADKAMDDVREKVDKAKGDLPSDADEPSVNEVNISAFPILLISLSGDLPDRSLQELAEYLKEEIETIPSVLEAKIGGKRSEQVDIIIDVSAIEGYGINLNTLINIVNQNNMMVSAGEQDTGDGSFNIKVPGLFENLEDVLDTPIKTFGDSVITFRDIAKVKRTFEDRKTYARVNGKNSVTIEVSKRIGENIIKTTDTVKNKVNKAKENFPNNLNISFSQDNSKYIKNMLNSLQNNVIAAIILVLIIILGALGIRSGFLVGVSIPGSFLSGVLALSLMGFTVNIVVLFALILSVGLLVDGAIVVVEYADRKINEGYSIIESYSAASKKMALPIIASTATTLAAFLPLIFWPGLAGEFMKYLPITLICVLTSSLFMALLFVPVVGVTIGSIFKILWQLIFPLIFAIIFFNLINIGINYLGFNSILLTIIKYLIPIIIYIYISIKIIPYSEKIKQSLNSPIKKISETAVALSSESKTSPLSLKGFTGFYAKSINKLLDHPAKVLISSIVILISIQVLYSRIGKGVEFFPEVEPDLSKIVIYARGNLSVEEKNYYVSRVENLILDIQKEKFEFKNIYSTSGNVSDQSESSEDFIGSVSLEYVDLEYRRPSKIILKEILTKTKSINGIKVETREQESGPPRGKPINIKLTSKNKELLFMEASRLKKFMDEFPGLVNVEDNLPAPGIEWEIKVNRKQASKFNANISSIGNVIKLSTNGIKLGEYRPDDTTESIPIYLRYPQEGRTLDMLQNLRVRTENGLVPISNFVEIVPKNRTGNIVRIDSKNAINIQTDVDIGIFADSKMKELEYSLGLTKTKPTFRGRSIDNIKTFDLNNEVSAKLTGESEDQKEAQEFLSKAFMVALFLMLMILLLQFNSFYSSFLILFAVLMSTAGVLIGLMVTGQAFGIVMTGVGVIALAGIVVNNNIILIDTFDYLKKDMPTIKEAIIKTGAQRLRPVLLTTFTTVLGLLPMVTMTNVDFFTRQIKVGTQDTQWWVQLSTAIVFGLIFATLLTLIVTPSLLMLRENLRIWYSKKINNI
ncbi:MAG: Cation efflux system protein CusA [Alphaproteobacteria bacterium MarineAlpha5_Bin8]|nr:MAG: Cation efflux system protein CusA [Alphaproteobacteria bacterium MarineAlpha5_Bin7]PPR46511.1 MAG: Cation efflux system protein CusA [Alphaproteobacteria bacterium MarineAlpha5_Bin8]PPR53199.1 MAG: Cation efflux system protein CusA [Alphaproteobacteria bacterium MarineAlpha5_Bin6]|tara:strand:- start:1434 stop:4829 length:3396 start_codon:yes stop_codon:yes gene_type:complete